MSDESRFDENPLNEHGTESEQVPESTGEIVDNSDLNENEDPLIDQDDDEVEETLPDLTSFEEAGLDEELVASINAAGWKNPTQIQSMCLPYTLAGKDLAGFAQTGTGKTGVFIITIAQQLLRRKKDPDFIQPFAIVLSPTRELAMQIESDAKTLLEPLNLSSMPVFGGVDYEKQARQLESGVDIVVATPGRLIDYVKKKVFTLDGVEVFVCDEADRMFDMGFIEDVKFFFKRLPVESQRLLFSATTSESVEELAFEHLKSPRSISATPESITPENIEQHAYICESTMKLKVLIGLLRDLNPTCSIIFTNTKITAEWLSYKLNHNGIQADLITGDLPQRKRMSLIKKIKDGEVKALIATDVASRGLHIPGVTYVFNFDLPDDSSNYVHRVGRTARAGAKGVAISLVCEDYGDNLRGINELLGAAAIKSEWYDPKYEQIIDVAGNPFVNRNSKKRDGNSARGPGRSSQRRDSGSRERSARGPRSIDQKASRSRKGPMSGNYRQEKSHASEKVVRNNGRDSDQRRARRSKQKPQMHEQVAKTHAPKTGEVRSYQTKFQLDVPDRKKSTHSNNQQSGFMGLIKRFFGAFLGKKGADDKRKKDPSARGRQVR